MAIRIREVGVVPTNNEYPFRREFCVDVNGIQFPVHLVEKTGEERWFEYAPHRGDVKKLFEDNPSLRQRITLEMKYRFSHNRYVRAL